MNTTIYLIRHSIRFDQSIIEEYKTSQPELIKSEKIILSCEGEERAKKLADLEELKNIDKVYASNCVRTLQTAKYLLAKQNLKVTIDERFDERRVGIPNSDQYPNWFELQYYDENYKTIGGESQKEVRERVTEAFREAVDENKHKRIAIFAHGYAITFFLMQWMKLINLDKDQKFTFSYNDEIIFDKKIDAPEIFKLVIDDNYKIIELKNIDVNY